MTAWLMDVCPDMITPSTGTVSPGRTRILSPIATWSAGMIFSEPSVMTRALRASDGPASQSASGPGNSQVLKQRAQLHDESHFARGKILADADRSDKGQGDEHIGFDVKGGDKSDDRFHDDRDAAENDRDPGRIKGQGDQVEQADDK